MTKYVALFYEADGDAEPVRSEEFEATSSENAWEAANCCMKTTETRIEVHPLPDGISDSLAVGDVSL
jgi:hypothetical protein